MTRVDYRASHVAIRTGWLQNANARLAGTRTGIGLYSDCRKGWTKQDVVILILHSLRADASGAMRNDR